MNTAAKIRSFREANLLTQSDLARKLEVEAVTVSRWERGVATPSALNRIRIARLAKKPPTWLLDQEDAA